MKTIDERVQRYCAAECPNASKEVLTLVCRTFKDGAKSEREELTRWHDPKDELPWPRQPVIVCTSPKIYSIASYDTEYECWFTEDGGACGRCEIIGWREIHEL